MFENRMLRRIHLDLTGRKGQETGRLHNEELHNLYASTNIIMVITLRRMKWMRGM
jgi:hypothetical protein